LAFLHALNFLALQGLPLVPALPILDAQASQKYLSIQKNPGEVLGKKKRIERQVSYPI